METFILLLRHGIAEPRGSEPEETRGLTKEGHKRMKEIGRAVNLIFPKSEMILSSPLRRCMQTAEWVVKAFHGQLALTTSPALRPEAGPEDLQKLIRETAARRMILVGHEPSLTAAMLRLTNMRNDGEVELKKGGCYGIRIDESGEAKLELMLSPRVLRATQ
jgi:phosphohistidine phosphatase